MKITCKFRVDKISKVYWSGTAEEITLSAVHGNNPENQSFADSTPNGSMTFLVTNPAVVGKFELGKEYYIELTPAN